MWQTLYRVVLVNISPLVPSKYKICHLLSLFYQRNSTRITEQHQSIANCFTWALSFAGVRCSQCRPAFLTVPASVNQERVNARRHCEQRWPAKLRAQVKKFCYALMLFCNPDANLALFSEKQSFFSKIWISRGHLPTISCNQLGNVDAIQLYCLFSNLL